MSTFRTGSRAAARSQMAQSFNSQFSKPSSSSTTDPPIRTTKPPVNDNYRLMDDDVEQGETKSGNNNRSSNLQRSASTARHSSAAGLSVDRLSRTWQLLVILMLAAIITLAVLYGTRPIQKVVDLSDQPLGNPHQYTFREVIDLNTYAHLMAPSTVEIWQQVILIDPSTDTVVANFTIESVTENINGTLTIHLSNGAGILALPNEETLIYTATNGESTILFDLEVDTTNTTHRRRLLTLPPPSTPPSKTLVIGNNTYSNFEVHVIYLGSNIRIPASVADGGRFVTKNECDSVCAAHCTLVTRGSDDPFNPPQWYLCDLSAIPDLQTCQESCPIPCSFVPDGYLISQISPPQWPPYTWTNDVVNSGFRRRADYVPSQCDTNESAPECVLPSGSYECLPPPNLNCSVVDNDTVCSCAAGYEDISVQTSYSSFNQLHLTATLLLDCRDKDECAPITLSPSLTPCPSVDWTCANTIGGFDCTCGAGHTQISSTICAVNSQVCQYQVCPSFSSCSVSSHDVSDDSSEPELTAVASCECNCGYAPLWPPDTADEDLVLNRTWGQCVPSTLETDTVNQQLHDQEVGSARASYAVSTVAGLIPSLAFNTTCWGNPSPDDYPAGRQGREYCCDPSQSIAVVDPSYSNGHCQCNPEAEGADPFSTGCSTCIPWRNLMHPDRCSCLHRNVVVSTSCTHHTFEFDICHCVNGFVGDEVGTCNEGTSSGGPPPPGDCSACLDLEGGTSSHLVACIRTENITNSSSQLLLGTCVCFPGFQPQNPELPFDSETNPCVDVNECDNEMIAVGQCGEGVPCFNFNGSFGCGCPDGYNWTYTLTPDLASGLGQLFYESTCTDINECDVVSTSNISGPCNGDESACVNLPGTFACQCRCGYNLVGGSTEAFDPMGPVCSDIDECAVGNVSLLCPQDPVSTCVNVPGTYCCVAGDGYTTTFSSDVEVDYFTPTCTTGVQTTCTSHFVDVDECVTHDATCEFEDPPQGCINTMGSYACVPAG